MKTSAVLRLLLVLIIGGAGIAAVGLLYQRKQASEPVWAIGEAEVKWEKERLPLGVWLDPGLADPYHRSLESAIDRINSQLMCPLLETTSDRGMADVEVLFEPCENQGHAGCAYYERVKKRGIIKTGRPGDIAQARVLFGHELGHILGLAHDGMVGRDAKVVSVSLMADNAPELADSLVRLTSKDVDALRERYCLKEGG